MNLLYKYKLNNAMKRKVALRILIQRVPVGEKEQGY